MINCFAFTAASDVASPSPSCLCACPSSFVSSLLTLPCCCVASSCLFWATHHTHPREQGHRPGPGTGMGPFWRFQSRFEALALSLFTQTTIHWIPFGFFILSPASKRCRLKARDLGVPAPGPPVVRLLPGVLALGGAGARAERGPRLGRRGTARAGGGRGAAPGGAGLRRQRAPWREFGDVRGAGGIGALCIIFFLRGGGRGKEFWGTFFCFGIRLEERHWCNDCFYTFAAAVFSRFAGTPHERLRFGGMELATSWSVLNVPSCPQTLSEGSGSWAFSGGSRSRAFPLTAFAYPQSSC